MRKLLCLTLMVIVAACALSLLQSVLPAAACDPWVNTYDAGGNPKTVFSLGEIVNVTAYSDVDYSILVVRPDKTSFTIDPITGDTTYSDKRGDLSTQLGWWELTVGDVNLNFAVGFFNVVPFAPLGVVGVLGACFVGAGVKLRKRTWPRASLFFA